MIYVIVPFWYASAAYQASLIEPWFVFWLDCVLPKFPMARTNMLEILPNKCTIKRTTR